MTHTISDVPMQLSSDDRQTAKQTDLSSRYIILSEFFADAESLRAQFEWRVALGRARGRRILAETAEPGIYRFFAAAADRVFTQEAVTNFLSHLRTWAEKAIGASHASSPQIQVFSKGCWREPSQDATPARWRYVYVLGPKGKGSTARLRLLPLALVPSRVFLAVSRVVAVELELGSLLVHEAELAYGIDKKWGESEGDSLCATTFLTGYLW